MFALGGCKLLQQNAKKKNVSIRLLTSKTGFFGCKIGLKARSYGEEGEGKKGLASARHGGPAHGSHKGGDAADQESGQGVLSAPRSGGSPVAHRGHHVVWKYWRVGSAVHQGLPVITTSMSQGRRACSR